MHQPLTDTNDRIFGVKLSAAIIDRIKIESVRRRTTIRAVMTALLETALPEDFEIVANGVKHNSK